MFCKLPPVEIRRCARFFALLVLAGGFAGLLALAGCGKGSDQVKDFAIAKVGDTEIMSSEYQRRLAKQEEKDLPRDDQGETLDMASLEGKRAFLQTIVNKELMYQKAKQLGYLNDPQIAAGRKALIEFEAGMAMREDTVNKPSRTISEEELQAFYDRMGTSRKCRYLITNFIEDAEAARAMALNDADWDDVVAEYHDGGPSPTGVFEIEVPYGRYGTDFEGPIYTAELGSVTEPILTAYGYWVLKVDQEIPPKPGSLPSLEDAKAEILDVAYNRKMAKNRVDAIKAVRDKYKFKINEDALWVCYQGLPEGEVLIDPATNEPPKREELKPLEIKPADMDMVFYSYETKDGVQNSTLGDYKAVFDRMNVFQRPKKSDLLGSLRNSLTQEMDKALMNRENEALGYFENPKVLAKVQEKMEEVLVSKLYKEIVRYEERVSPEDLTTFWDEHSQEYYIPETRSGKLVVCRNQEEAVKARAAAQAGVDWHQLLVQYGTDRENKSKDGKLTDIPTTATGPIRDALFALETGSLSEPFALEEGQYGLVLLESVTPGRPAELLEISETVGQRIRTRRQEEAFQALLAQWTEEFGVTIYEDKLEGLLSWEELVHPVLENVIPRNQ